MILFIIWINPFFCDRLFSAFLHLVFTLIRSDESGFGWPKPSCKMLLLEREIYRNAMYFSYDWWYCAGARGEQQWAGPRPAAVSRCCRRGIQLRVRIDQVLRPLRLGRRAVLRHHPHRRHPARSGQMSAPGNMNMVLVRSVFRIRTRRIRKFFVLPDPDPHEQPKIKRTLILTVCDLLMKFKFSYSKE